MLQHVRSTLMNRRALFALILTCAMLMTFMPIAATAAPAEAPAASGAVHIVKKGETLSHIARYYGVTVNALANANGISNASYIYVGQRIYIPSSYGAPAGCTSYYHVKHGDTLSQIAAWYGINTYALANSNGLSNASYIYVGQKLCIPSIYGGGYAGGHHSGGYGSGYYVVKAGDTLSEIAQWNGTSVHHLMYVNGLHNPNHIYIGQKLRIW
ncbi:MAG: LysM peptidoglycan-binding domain-containing protein [Caldilineaceae bacterium]|nr:LysM peptidoglycan-binding domain-containing protein [Caldilineaceae bacterium]